MNKKGKLIALLVNLVVRERQRSKISSTCAQGFSSVLSISILVRVDLTRKSIDTVQYTVFHQGSLLLFVNRRKHIDHQNLWSTYKDRLSKEHYMSNGVLSVCFSVCYFLILSIDWYDSITDFLWRNKHIGSSCFQRSLVCCWLRHHQIRPIRRKNKKTVYVYEEKK